MCNKKMMKKITHVRECQLLKQTTLLLPLPLLVTLLLYLTTSSLLFIQAQVDYDDVVVSSNQNNNQQENKTKNDLTRPERLTVLAPKYLRPLSDYHVLINLANSPVPVTIDLTVIGARDSNQERAETKTTLVNPGESQTLKFSIGDWPSAEYVLSVTAQATDKSWNFTQETTLNYQAKSYSGFIQTDKAIYKPAQLVQFRAIFLDQNLIPVSIKDEINVSILDPRKNLIKQWQNQSNYRGLLSLELQLSEDPPLGDWTIKVESRKQEFSKQFKIAEYILPTYEVSIQLPSYATYNESDIVATVRAVYTYGKPVNGHVTLTVQPLVRLTKIDTRPLNQAQYRSRLTHGSAEFSLDLVKDLRQLRDSYEREIEFFALVEEDLTDRKYNKTELMKIHDKNIKIELINDKTTFKPGLNHLFQLKVAYQDDIPVEDQGPELELRISSLGDLLESVKLHPQGGIVEHSFEVPKRIKSSFDPNHEVSPRHLTLEVVYRGHKHYLNQISAHHSQSEQYLQISLPQVEARNRRLRKSKTASSSSRLALIDQNNHVSVNDELKIKVKATEPMVTQITCQGLARGDIIWAVSRDGKGQSEFEFDVMVHQRMTPEARILCFYIRPENKELIGDSIGVSVSGLVRNSVKLTTSRDEAKPGQTVEVSVQTKPKALVGVLGIDQSVLLLKSGNDISQEDLASEAKSYGKMSSNDMEAASNAAQMFDQANVVVLTNNLVYSGDGYDEGRLLYAGGVYVKRARISQPQSQAFSNKEIALGSLILEHQLTPPEFHINRPKSDPLVIRSVFPETWLWEQAEANSDGGVSFSSKIPDTITSWVLSAFSLSESHGFGLSSGKTSVKVFRPFFIKLNLPYSIVRGETVNIQAIIFNYSKRPVTAKVTLENKQGDFEFVEAANSVEEEKHKGESSESRLIQIPAQDGAQVSFLVTPRKLGNIDIRMLAQSDFAADGVVKKLLVKPEGQTQHLNKALLINLDGSELMTKNITLEVPSNAVPRSQKVYASAVGDLLGPGLSNVDDLLRLPYGCGEQNMINLVPNIVIYNYLQMSRRLKEAQRTRALRNIEAGYQRQLNYKRSDGSFSAFGQSDTNGSVWLTAYVLKTFQQAKSMITIDEKVIRRAANFIASLSRSDGSIEEVGMLHNKQLQSVAAATASEAGYESQPGQQQQQESPYLTAYAMVALLQAPIQHSDPELLSTRPLDEVLQRGLNYLERHLEQTTADGSGSNYDLAIIAYALQLANRTQSAQLAYDQLWARANNADGATWWENQKSSKTATTTDETRESTVGNNEPMTPPPTYVELEREFETFVAPPQVRKETSSPPLSTSTIPPLKPIVANKKHSEHLFIPESLSIEMTALALLTAVRRADLERAMPIVKWLISQQNSRGGFASTQDTVLAIEALAAFASATNSKSIASPKLEIELKYPRITGSASATTTGGSFRRHATDELQITGSNALVNQQLRLPDNITWVQIQASGTGVGVFQVAWQYNLLVSAEKPAFYLNPILDKTSNINYLQLSICTFYKAGESSNMAVMEVELPSGYVADVEALPGLLRTPQVKRVDRAAGDTKVMIYFDKVTRDEICLTVQAHRTSKVSNNQPMPVSIYDYYNRQHTARIFYSPELASSCDICDSDNCNDSCLNKPKRANRLVSLHEQRKLAALRAPGQQHSSTHGNLTFSTSPHDTNSNSTTSSSQQIKAQQLLPLAPVLRTLVSVARSLTNTARETMTLPTPVQ